MFSFVKKWNPFRRDSVRTQNELHHLNTVETESYGLPFHSAQQSHCSNIFINNNGEKIPGNHEVEESQRKGINKLLKEFEKENIKVTTLMDQDGRIFFSIEMTDIIENDEELKNMARAVQESLQDSSYQLMKDKGADEVYRKLKKHFLFESAKNISPVEATQITYVHRSSSKEKSDHVSNDHSEHCGHIENSLERNTLNAKSNSTKNFTISADETELNSLLYSYILSKMEKKNIEKKRVQEKTIEPPIQIPHTQKEETKKEANSITKINQLISVTKINEHVGTSQIIIVNKKKENSSRYTEKNNCKHKQKLKEVGETLKSNTDPCESLQILKKRLERKLRKRLLPKEKQNSTKTRNIEERKQESIEHVPKKRKHNKDGHRRKAHEKNNRSKNKLKTTDDDMKHIKPLSWDIEEQQMQLEKIIQGDIKTPRRFHKSSDKKPDFKSEQKFFGSSSSRSKIKSISQNSKANLDESDYSEEVTRSRVLEFENDPSEKLIAITTFE